MQAQAVILWSETSISLALYNEAGEREQIWYHIALNEIVDHVNGHCIVVALLTPDISFMQANIPPLSERALRKAVPYALENECVDDVETLHFAVHEADLKTPRDVAVVSKTYLRAMITLFEEAHLTPDVVIPACLLLPSVATTWTIASNASIALVRVSDGAGFVCDVMNLKFMLQQAMMTYGQPSALMISETQLSNDIFPTTMSIQQTQVSEVEWIDVFLGKYHSVPALNLLQGEFRSRKKQSSYEHPVFKNLRWGIYAWIGLSVIVPLISWVMLSLRLNALDSSMNAIYKRYVPEAKTMTLASHQLDAKWREATQSGNDSHFLQMLAALGQANHTASGVMINELSFDGQCLRLVVNAQSSSQLTTWSNAVLASGFDIKQTSADILGERIHATILIH